MEGDFRACHSSIIDHSEEIAFYRGTEWEKNRMNDAFEVLYDHIKNVYEKKLFMGVFDSMSVKHGAVICGYIILGLSIFKKKQIDTNNITASAITKEFVKNSSLLINYAKV